MSFFRSRRTNEVYFWTAHSRAKMRYYRLTESRLKRAIRHPARVEEGIVEGAVAAMSPAGGSQYSEIWVMYVVSRGEREGKRIKVITAWRYPGKAPARNPVPAEVLREVERLIGGSRK